MDKVKAVIVQISDFLDGNKTYLVALGSIGTIGLAWAHGQMTDGDAMQKIVALLFTMTFRSALKK